VSVPNPIRVALVEDHHVVRRGLRSYLDSFPDLAVVGEAASGEDALHHIAAWAPDVVVMDLSMPGGMDGIETTRRLRASYPRVQVVALTSYTDEPRVVAAIRAGVLGYVRKDADPEVLLASVRAAAGGQSLLDAAAASAVLREMSRSDSPGAALTDRENDVLHQLVLGRTNREIAATLVVSGETVKTHVANILTKLQLAHRTQVAIYALKRGLISLEQISLDDE
jgi:NarL family two-component system response regulator LiaR